METLQSPLNENQLALLRMFAHPVDEADWKQVRNLIVSYFAQKTVDEANKVWDEQGWNEAKVQELIGTHMRTPYRRS